MRLLKKEEIPPQLFEIPEPPKQLYCDGTPPPVDALYLAVVGSRKHTNYGKDVCEKLIAGLRGYPIVIVSGLALGIDSIAHRAALSAGLTTVAFLGSGIDSKVFYPSSNRELREKIVGSGGAVMSEYEPNFRATEWSFPRRNRLEAGIAKAVLIIEAEEKSGTLITSRLATEYNRDVFTVPGPIFSPNSVGTNMLLRLGATPITKSEDILQALGFEIEDGENKEAEQSLCDCSADELAILELLLDPTPRDELIRTLDKPAYVVNMTLSIMEIKGLIKEELGEIRRV